MSRELAVKIPATENYDNCLISSCLKKLFTKNAKSADAPVLIVRSHVAEVKKELEKLNTEKIAELSYEYLLAMEQSIPGATFRYALIYRDGIPVLFTCFQLFTLTSRNFSLDNDKGFARGIFRFFLNLKKIKILIAGNALRNETPCCCYNPAVVSAEAAAEIVASAAEKIADDEGAAAVILKDIQAPDIIKKWLEELGYKRPWEDKVMVMDIQKRWDSLERYITDLSRKYKTMAGKIIAAGKDITMRQLSAKEIEQHKREISRLFKNVADNQSFVLTSPNPDHFVALKQIYKDSFEFLGFFHGNKMVAFSSAFIVGDDYEIYYVGFDYDHNIEYQLYFNILFTGLARGIALKKRRLKLGRTSFDAKASIGAKPVEMGYLIKMVNIPGIVSKWFINYFSNMEDSKWKLRNPLKQPV